MINYNVNNVVFPSIINDIKVEEGMIIKNQISVPNVNVGQKYYGIFNNKCIAFKLVSICFGEYNVDGLYQLIHTDNFTALVTLKSTMFYELIIADGSHVYYSLSDFIQLPKFHTKEDYFGYVESKSENYKVGKCRMNDTSYFKAIMAAFGDNLGISMNAVHKIDYIYLKGFIANKGRVTEHSIPLRYLWIDSDGVHYSAHNSGRHNERYYLTEREAKISLMEILDFDDEDSSSNEIIQINISIKASDKDEIFNVLEKYFES